MDDNPRRNGYRPSSDERHRARRDEGIRSRQAAGGTSSSSRRSSSSERSRSRTDGSQSYAGPRSSSRPRDDECPRGRRRSERTAYRTTYFARDELKRFDDRPSGPGFREAQRAGEDREGRSDRPRRNTSGRSASPSPSLDPHFFILLAAVIAIAAIAIFGLTRLIGCAQQALNPPEAQPAAVQQDEPTAETVDFDAVPSALDGIPQSEGLGTFCLSGLSAPELSDEQASAIDSAVAAAEEQGDVSFVFYDVESGRGLSYAPDTVVYGASSFKAIYALYVCETLIETGELSLDSYCPVSYVSDSGSYYGNSGEDAYPVGELIEAAVIYSDNNAFGFLRDSYDYLGFDEWAASAGAQDVIESETWFPFYCARSSAKLWTEMLSYLSSGSETATWLEGLLGSTEVSFIRDALYGEDSTEESSGLAVFNKAGWIADPDPDYNALCDAGIITSDGHTYVMSIMTGMPNSDNNREKIGDIASALFEARSSLNLKQ